MQNTLQLLQSIARDYPHKGILIHSPGSIQGEGVWISYRDLLRLAEERARFLRHIKNFAFGDKILLHFSAHVDNITWYWASLCAGLVPVISTPLAHDLCSRQKHLDHLCKTLDNPVCLTTEKLEAELRCASGLEIWSSDQVLSLPSVSYISEGLHRSGTPRETDIAALMLTSGSTGTSKAVCLRHGQILRAISGKSQCHSTRENDVFLNWIGFDHVANFTEIHMHALSIGATQIHIQATDALAQPIAFLQLLSKYHVSYTFAPNFFLAVLDSAIEKEPKFDEHGIELSQLRCFISGGEANPVAVIRSLSLRLASCGAPASVIRPGFGMTETCAGSIYHSDCPEYDIRHNYEIATLGHCIPGLSARIHDEDGHQAKNGQQGNLELSGPILFSEYYNNPAATAAAFTIDGWFMTGDTAFTDEFGNINLVGRTKDTIIINGVKYPCHELELAIEAQQIPGISTGHTVAFPHRSTGSSTEDVCVVYLPKPAPEGLNSTKHVKEAIFEVLVPRLRKKPLAVIALDEKALQKTSLGKLSRSKIKAAYERGDYRQFQEEELTENGAHGVTETEKVDQSPLQVLVAKSIAEICGVPLEHTLPSTNIFDLGMTSVHMIQLKRHLETKLDLQTELPLLSLIQNPTAVLLGECLENFQSEIRQYNPTVILQSKGRKCPLWLIHPGVGEILVFIPLIKYIKDRPVYALRARGFGESEAYFRDINEAVETYYQAIKSIQPEGPYALAGYSYGAMLAFETAKRLELTAEVKFLGSFNLPPHIKYRMRQLDWLAVLLHLLYFLGIIHESDTHYLTTELQGLPSDDALDRVLAFAGPSRIQELNLDKQTICKWVDLAHNLQAMAREYEPSGSVHSIDVFCAQPLAVAAPSYNAWVKFNLRAWDDFTREERGARLHAVGGSHYTMLGQDHIVDFQEKLQQVLTTRGL